MSTEGVPSLVALLPLSRSFVVAGKQRQELREKSNTQSILESRYCSDQIIIHCLQDHSISPDMHPAMSVRIIDANIIVSITHGRGASALPTFCDRTLYDDTITAENKI